MTTYKVLIQRFKTVTPKFFKRIIHIGFFLGTLGGGLAVAGDNIPKEIKDKAGYLITIGITAASVAKFTTEDKETLIKSEEILKKE